MNEIFDPRECSISLPRLSKPTVINPAADFNAREYNLPGHVEGLRMNDPITLASLFGILAHAATCTGCSQCLIDGN